MSTSYTTFAIALDPATSGSGPSAVVTIAQPTTATFANASNIASVCKATITSSSAMSTTLRFSVNHTGFVVQ